MMPSSGQMVHITNNDLSQRFCTTRIPGSHVIPPWYMICILYRIYHIDPVRYAIFEIIEEMTKITNSNQSHKSYRKYK
jgi:hypothetical protein